MDYLVQEKIYVFMLNNVKVWVFLTLLSVGVIGLLVNVLLSVFKNNYRLLDRLWFAFLLGALTAFGGSATLIFSDGAEFILILIGVYALFSLSLVYPKSKPRFSSSQLEFARLMDGKAREQKDVADGFSALEKNVNLPTENLRLKPENDEFTQQENSLEKEIDGLNLDFSHVKKVLTRLDYFSLSPCDKRQVRELENLLLRAEKGESGLQIKEEINDGLGALLKIMSKYGV